MISSLKNYLYFVPVVGSVHLACELNKLSHELDEISGLTPSFQGLTGRVTKPDEFWHSISEVEALPVQQKIRVSNYFVKKSQVIEWAYGGSFVQVAAGVMALPFSYSSAPFWIFYRLGVIQNLFALYKLVTGQTKYYHYDQLTGTDGTRINGEGFFKFVDKCFK